MSRTLARAAVVADRHVTGLSREVLAELVAELGPRWQARQDARLADRPRQRAVGAGARHREMARAFMHGAVMVAAPALLRSGARLPGQTGPWGSQSPWTPVPRPRVGRLGRRAAEGLDAWVERTCLVSGARFPVVLLPGALLPASARYAQLVEALDSRDAWPKDLELYAGAQPPDDYEIDAEVAGLRRFVDARGADRFHLYGHSVGGSIALAFAAEHGNQLLSLALDELATDFSAEDRELIAALWTGSLEDLPVPQRMQTFARAQVRPGVQLPPPPSGPPSAEMAGRPAGLAAIERAIADYRIDESALRRFAGPVYFSTGSLSNARWELMADRLAGRFRDFEVERYEGLHHLNTSHAAEPERVAAALQRLWGRAEENPPTMHEVVRDTTASSAVGGQRVLAGASCSSSLPSRDFPAVRYTRKDLRRSRAVATSASVAATAETSRS